MKKLHLLLLLVVNFWFQAQVNPKFIEKLEKKKEQSPDKVLKSADSLLAKYPNDFKVMNIAGDSAWRLNDENNALKYFIQSVNKNPKQENVYDWISQLFEKKGMYDKSIDYLSKGLTVFPKSALLLSSRAYQYYNIKDYTQSKSDDLAAIKIRNNHANNYDRLAMSAFYLKEENPTQYFDLADKVPTIKKSEIWLRRGLYYAAGPRDYAKAKVEFDRIFEKRDFPEFSAGDLNLMGVTCYKNKELDNAEKLFTGSLERKEDPDVMGNLAGVIFDKQEYQRLLTYAKDFVQKYPNHVMANAYYGAALIKTGQTALGNQYLDKSERLDKEQKK